MMLKSCNLKMLIMLGGSSFGTVYAYMVMSCYYTCIYGHDILKKYPWILCRYNCWKIALYGQVYVTFILRDVVATVTPFVIK